MVLMMVMMVAAAVAVRVLVVHVYVSIPTYACRGTSVSVCACPCMWADGVKGRKIDVLDSRLDTKRKSQLGQPADLRAQRHKRKRDKRRGTEKSGKETHSSQSGMVLRIEST